MRLWALSITLICLSVNLAWADDELDQEKELSRQYYETMSQEPDALIVEDGIVIRPIYKSLSTVFPTLDQNVEVAYHLVDREGNLIEESLTSDETVSFPLRRLIQCWQKSFPKISVGSSYKITCTSEHAYGDRGAGEDIKPGAALTFRIMLFAISDSVEEAPRDSEE